MKCRDSLTLSITFTCLMAAATTSAIPLPRLRSYTTHAATLAARLSDLAAYPLFTNVEPKSLSVRSPGSRMHLHRGGSVDTGG